MGSSFQHKNWGALRDAPKESRRRTAPGSHPPGSHRGHGLIQQALHTGSHAANVVCDRWFTTPTLVRGIVRETGCDVIGKLKNGSPHYQWKGQRGTLAQIYRGLRSTWSRHDLPGSVVVQLPTSTGLLPFKLVFIRDRRGHSCEWLARFRPFFLYTRDLF